MNKFSFNTIACFLFVLTAYAQPEFNLKAPIPLDSSVRKGTLSNGMVYYIKQNSKPEKRAELRLVVNAGSNYENDDQQGLAHFVEHMAFNGTKNFKKNELVNYLESVGTKFGAHLNAYTSFDETVYMLQLPTDSEKVFLTGFQVLEDWAHNLSFDADEIEKERGVVISERRNGLGAYERMNQKIWPIMFKGSRYAERLPIGKLEVLEKCTHETLKQFYYDWYRPDLMSVIAVGDFNVDSVEAIIKKQFSGIAPKENPRSTQLFNVPGNNELLVAKASDKEAQYTVIQLSYKQPKEYVKTLNDYGWQICYDLYNRMIGQRLEEITLQPNPPFTYAYMGYGSSLARTRNEYSCFAVVSDKNIERGLEALLTENVRVKFFGFNESELEREKTNLMRSVEKQYNERNKTESRSLVNSLINNCLENEPAPSIEFKYAFYKKHLPKIAINDVYELGRRWITDNGRDLVISIEAPDKPGVVIPTDDELKALLAKVLKKEVKPYEDKTPTKPLMVTKPTAGKISTEKQIKNLGITELEFLNGLKVVLKPTDFKNDEILFNAFSPGGTSRLNDKNFSASTYASYIISQSGLGEFDFTALTKLLTGKIVSVSPYIGELKEGLYGSCSPTDIETVLQLIYLYFTSPRKDETAFASLIERQKSFIENRQSSPESAFSDTVLVTMAQYHYRSQPTTLKTLNDINLTSAYEFYKNRFADAGNFTFFFTGNFNADSIKPLLASYLGSLPSIKRHETWKDVNRKPPKGVVEKTIKRGSEPKSVVELHYTGTTEYNQHSRIVFGALKKLLEIKLREAIREDEGGTYGVSVYGSPTHYPVQSYSLTIHFGCDPKNVEKLTNAVFDVFDRIKKKGVEEENMIKIKETMRREYEVSFKENNFWLNTLSNYYFDNENITQIPEAPKIAERLTSSEIKDAANKYLNNKNYAKFVLMPEK